MDIPIIFEDQDLLIISKPAGVTVNKADTTRHEITVQDWAENYLKISSSNWQVEAGNDFINRGGVVHRLDKETSGVMILAKNPKSFSELQKQFKERIVEKKYLALASGKVVPEKGEINVPVGRLPWNRMQFGVVPGGRESVTFYAVVDYYRDDDKKDYTFLELSPKTGRTHQIRVHLRYLGHPIFADFLYAGRKTARDERKILNRVFLHAAQISFQHPATQERVLYNSPLPAELGSVLNHMTKLQVGN